MVKSKQRIPYKVIKEIFPERLNRSLGSQQIYTHLKQMIISGKLKRGQKLTYEGIAHDFNISKALVHKVIFQLKKDGLIISKGRKGSFIV